MYESVLKDDKSCLDVSFSSSSIFGTFLCTPLSVMKRPLRDDVSHSGHLIIVGFSFFETVHFVFLLLAHQSHWQIQFDIVDFVEKLGFASVLGFDFDFAFS